MVRSQGRVRPPRAQESPDRHQAAHLQVGQSKFEGARIDAVTAPPSTCFLFGFLQSRVHKIYSKDSRGLYDPILEKGSVLFLIQQGEVKQPGSAAQIGDGFPRADVQQLSLLSHELLIFLGLCHNIKTDFQLPFAQQILFPIVCLVLDG